MGKQSKKNKKIQQQQQVALGKFNKTITKDKPVHVSDSDDSSSKDYINQSDLSITLETLKKLGNRVDILRSVKYKPLRAALHPLFEDKVRKEGTNAILSNKNLGNSISSAVYDGRFDEAITMLEEFARKKITLKLGTVMRWVRDVNLITLEPNRQCVRVMYAIMKCYPEFQGKDYDTPSDINMDIEEESKGELVQTGEFVTKPLRDDLKSTPNPYTKDDFEILLTEKGTERKPPNQYDLDIFETKSHIVYPSSKFSEAELPKIERVDVPWVPGAFVINNVLTPEDCEQIVHMAETMGYKLDVPIGSEAEFRAHGCVWLADQLTNGYIFDRCKALLPNLDGEALGFNARWRIYKYNVGNVYRPHIDGAWPGSAKVNGQYQFDGYGDRYSKLTCVIYLTEGFKGGHTTFYTPSPSQKGCIEARGVSPRIGSILFFPHGEQAGALIHEGSGVSDGCKIIIRTDLLYPIKKEN